MNDGVPLPAYPQGADIGRGYVPPRPSDIWVRQPAWVGTCLFVTHTTILTSFFSDGAVNPPRLYHSHEEMLYTLRYYCPGHPLLRVQQPTPAAPVPSANPAAPSGSPVLQPSDGTDSPGPTGNAPPLPSSVPQVSDPAGMSPMYADTNNSSLTVS